MWKRKTLFLLTVIMVVILVAACGEKAATPVEQPTETVKETVKEPEAQKEAPPKPVTLKVWLLQPLTDEEFNVFIVQPVQAQYPHISFEPIRTTGTNFDQLVAANLSTDLIYMHDGALAQFADLGVTFPIEELVRQHQIDLNAFAPEFIEAVRSYSPKRELYALPHSVKYPALFYNKTLFDRFGVPYPRDGMIWDEIFELTPRLARDGFIGLDIGTWGMLVRQLGAAGFVDPATLKPTVNTPEMRTVFDLTRRVVTIPGNAPEVLRTYPGRNNFVKGVLAMLTTQTNFLPSLYGQTLDWDVAQFPNVQGRGNIGYDTDIDIFTPFSTSQNKDDVIRVMKVVTSPAVQRLNTERIRATVLKDKSIIADFGKQIPELQGKSTSSIFKTTLIPPPPRNKHYSPVSAMVRDAYFQYVEASGDINTILRELEEQIAKYVQENK